MNFVFLVRSFVVNLVFLVIFLSKYVHQFPENIHFRFLYWGEIFFNACTAITFWLSSTEPVVYQVFGWKMGHILGVSLQKHGVFLKGGCCSRAVYWSGGPLRGAGLRASPAPGFQESAVFPLPRLPVFSRVWWNSRILLSIPFSISLLLYGIIPFPLSFISPFGFSFLFPFLLEFIF